MEHLGAVRFRALQVVGEAKEMASAICEHYFLLTPVHSLINIGNRSRSSEVAQLALILHRRQDRCHYVNVLVPRK